MPKSALPEWYHEKAKGTGTDWDNPIQGWMRKAWFGYGPRASEWWARWREFPITLLAIRSKQGVFRTETEGWTRDSSRSDYHNRVSLFNQDNIRLVFWEEKKREIVQGYLSAIQYWTKWHVQIQWPFFVAFHYYIDEVPRYPEKGSNKRVVYFRFGARRDADKTYWFPSLFIGLSWN